MKEPIETCHPHYDSYFDKWKKARDFYEGEDAVKDEEKKYLPSTNDQPQPHQQSKYMKYLKRAPFYEATSRTVEGLVGLATHKPHTFNVPESMADLDRFVYGDATMSVFIQNLLRENILTARQGILIDRDRDGGDPYMVQYKAEDITNWYEDDDGNLELVILRECYIGPKPGENPYMFVEQAQYRELVMIDGQYVQRLWQKAELGSYVIVDEFVPTNRGKALDHIPFYFASFESLGTQIEKAPIMGLVNTNCHHYQLSADLAHVLHYIACPTVVLTGVDEQGAITLGSDMALKISQPDAKAYFLEIAGDGVPAIERSLANFEDRMAKLGSRLLEASKSGVESAEALRIRQGAESSALLTVVTTAEALLEASLMEIATWENMSAEIDVQLNKDFVNTPLSPQEMQALISAYQSGTISKETLLHNFKQGEILPDDRSVEDEMQLLEGSEDTDQTEI